MFKQEKGITLVSLVITIIVMLILAGVSLSMVMGEGSVLNQARDAVDTTELSSVKDEIGMALGSAQTNYYAKYASTTGRITMQQALLLLEKNEFTSAKEVEIIAPKNGTGKILYTLENDNKYFCEFNITDNSLTAVVIDKAETDEEKALATLTGGDADATNDKTLTVGTDVLTTKVTATGNTYVNNTVNTVNPGN